jgi:SAM-dependent methyltransferase
MTTATATAAATHPALIDGWKYQRGSDMCGDFFETMLRAFPAPIPANANVLEVGCAEFDWLGVAKASWPEMRLTGIDARARPPITCATVIAGDALDERQFAPNTFDWIVSVSAIEHVGLGHYGDPVNPHGDSDVLANIHAWLKPGGWLAFDVPYQPGAGSYRVDGTRTRIYDDFAIDARLSQGLGWRQAWNGIVYLTQPYKLLTNPEPLPQVHKYDMYVRGHWWQKK